MANKFLQYFKKTEEEITPLYDLYNKEFNFITQAASEKAVALFLTLIKFGSPSVIVETGTGFSTYVLESQNIPAVHFEDNRQWADRLSEWVGVFEYGDFGAFPDFVSEIIPFNCVAFLDSSLDYREFVIDELYRNAEYSIALIDDMHFGDDPLDIKPLARKLCPKGTIYDAKPLTLDRWGRYSWVFVGDMIDHELQLSKNYLVDIFGEPVCEH